ncbi:MAG: hypothetical protein Q7S16_00185 [bacterium]|nr:hypothetical protein [bacterium]
MAQIINFSTHPLRTEKNHGGASKETAPPKPNLQKAQIIELRPVTLEELLDAVESGESGDVSMGNVLLTFDEVAEFFPGDIKQRKKRALALPPKSRAPHSKLRTPRSKRASGTS